MKNIYDLTEHELTVEGRRLVKALYAEIGTSLELEAFIDEGKIVFKVPKRQLGMVTERYRQLIGNGEFMLNITNVTMSLPRDR